MNENPTSEQIAIMARAAVHSGPVIQAANLPVHTKAVMAMAVFLSLSDEDTRIVAGELFNEKQCETIIMNADNPDHLVALIQDAVYLLFEVWIDDYVTEEVIQQAYIDAGEATAAYFEDLR
jgi:hypothetical protein